MKSKNSIKAAQKSHFFLPVFTELLLQIHILLGTCGEQTE